MKMTRNSEPQFLAILRHAEGGVPVAGLCRDHGMMPSPGNRLQANGRPGTSPQSGRGLTTPSAPTSLSCFANTSLPGNGASAV